MINLPFIRYSTVIIFFLSFVNHSLSSDQYQYITSREKTDNRNQISHLILLYIYTYTQNIKHDICAHWTPNGTVPEYRQNSIERSTFVSFLPSPDDQIPWLNRDGDFHRTIAISAETRLVIPRKSWYRLNRDWTIQDTSVTLYLHPWRTSFV